jgi:hypothetical protein
MTWTRWITLAAVAVATLPARRAAADLENPGFLPFGERASFLGNAGITSPTGEAVYYNPANLARIEQPNLSVSGNIYVRFTLEADALLTIEGVDQPFKASGFISNPSTLISTYEIGDWSLASAVLIPEALELKNRSTLASPSLRVTVLQDHAEESLWIGGGIARAITPSLRVGLSVFFTRDSSADINLLRFDLMTDAGRMVSEVVTNTDQSVLNLVAVPGIYWQATDALGIGLRARTPPIKLSGSADIYQSFLTPGDDAGTFEQEFADVNVSAPAPLELGLGISYRATPRLELVLDGNLQLPGTLTTVDEPEIPEIGTTKVEVEWAPRLGVGMDWQVASAWWLRLGGLYNKSALPEPKEASDDVREDFYGVTGGIAWQKDRTTTALGTFFLYSPVDLLVEGSDPLRKADANEKLYGALLTIAYRL